MILHHFTLILNYVKINIQSGFRSVDVLISRILKGFELKMTWNILQNWVYLLPLCKRSK